MDTVARDTADLVAGDLATHWDAAQAFPPTGGVFGRLFREGYHFNFFQAVRLLERYFEEAPPPGLTWDVRRERIVFRPYSALVFPAADVRRVEALEEPAPHARLELTFMGLYGVDSPLPVYFYDDLAAERPGTEALRDLLDIFNHRLYAYFYQAWKKYRPDVGHGIPGQDRHAVHFLSGAGLSTDGALSAAPLANHLRLAAFAGWLAPHARHAEGLSKLLAAAMGYDAVEIEQNVQRWVKLPERPRMGEGGGFALGGGAAIGARVPDRSGHFRLRIGPVDAVEYLALRPGEEKARLLAFLVRLYAPDYLDYDVELLLDTSTIPPVRLGMGDVHLGVTTWLGKPREPVIPLRMRYS